MIAINRPYMDCYWDFLSFWLFVLLRFDVDHLDFDIEIGKLWEQKCTGARVSHSWDHGGWKSIR